MHSISASCALNTEDSRMILLAIHEARGKTEEAQFICIWQQKKISEGVDDGYIKDSLYDYLYLHIIIIWASQVAQWYRIPLPIQGTWVQSLDWEDPLEKEMATHFSVLAWEIPWTEEPGGLPPRGSQTVRLSTYVTITIYYLCSNFI